MYKFSQTPVNCPKIETEHRKIATAIPSPETIEILEICAKNEPDSMNDQLPIVWDSAKDFYIYDKSGNQWIDFTSGIFVTNVGHANPMIIQAIQNEINKKLLNAYYYPTKERADFSELLLKITPNNINKVFYLSTGSEAVEAAIKMAIKFTNRKKIISFDNAFHGKTMGSHMAGGKHKAQAWIPVETYVKHIEYPNSWALNEKNITGEEFFNAQFVNIDPSVYAAIIVEPYQGWSAEFLPYDYAQSLKKWCDKNNVLLIVDEIQSGFGRTGKMFAFEHFDIIPDIITCGKGISSSLPLSCVLTREEITNIDISLNSTHGGNPLIVAASNASLKFIIDQELVKESKRKGKILYNELIKWKNELQRIISWYIYLPPRK